MSKTIRWRENGWKYQDAGEKIGRTKQRGERVIAVGPPRPEPSVFLDPEAGSRQARSVFAIHPPYRRVIGALINFHLPKSTLIMLVPLWQEKIS
jgi:S-adenosylmethionine:tRNA-ribosyltransferase-isomerase (queuine synthetase)